MQRSIEGDEGIEACCVNEERTVVRFDGGRCPWSEKSLCFMFVMDGEGGERTNGRMV